MERARRRHVPAFGEWNYSSSSSPDEPAAGTGWSYAPPPAARGDAWFGYAPPSRGRPGPRKLIRRPQQVAGSGVAAAPPETLFYSGGGHDRGATTAVRARERAPHAGGRTVARPAPAKGAARRAVRPVDEDLYQVPPPDTASGRPRRKRAARGLWMGCLGGLNCVA
ncbi:hypothetical protein ACP70R_018223 [Stipagrostis hirtigluma subsp. patula]